MWACLENKRASYAILSFLIFLKNNDVSSIASLAKALSVRDDQSFRGYEVQKRIEMSVQEKGWVKASRERWVLKLLMNFMTEQSRVLVSLSNYIYITIDIYSFFTIFCLFERLKGFTLISIHTFQLFYLLSCPVKGGV
jgi:hypothetical protein